MTRLRNSSLLIFLFCFLSSMGQQAVSFDSLDTYIQKAVNDFEVPGFAVGVVKDGEVVFAKAYGRLNAHEETPVNEHSVFGIASCSKAFTAACMAILVDEGKLAWDDKVIDHYPGFKLYDPFITRELTIRDLLSHRAGYQTFDGDLLWYGSDYSREEVIQRFAARQQSYSMRSQFGYSNIMFIAAGQVILNVTGRSWDDFVKEKIFDPLGMQHSSTTNRGFEGTQNVAYPHVNGKALSFENYDNSGPAASINTSVSDLLLWVQLMLNKGQLGDRAIFSSTQYYQLVSPHTIINAGKAETIHQTHFSNYGMGWFMYDYQGRKIIHHGGGLPGFHSKVVFIPEEQLGFVILSNQLSGLVPAIERQLRDVLLGVEGKDWASLILENVEKNKLSDQEEKEAKAASRITGTTPSLTLEKYVGTYEDSMYGKAQIQLIDGQLSLTLLPARELFTATMNHWHYDTFQFQFNDPFLPEGWLSFVLDGNAEPDYFTIDLPNPDFHFFKLKFEKTK